jgi:dTDP-4-dehydrorhamnose 3,5-epimerase-like enzyme
VLLNPVIIKESWNETRSVLHSLEFDQLPFTPHRTYWITDMAPGERRGRHAHKALEQVMIAIKGQIRVELMEGNFKQEFILNETDRSLFIPPKFWREFECLDRDSIILVLASDSYNENDYIRDQDSYLKWFLENK